MKSWVLASGNRHKREELAAMLAPLSIELVGPEALDVRLEVDETGTTFLANAVLKAAAWAEATGLPTLADDSGLEVDALGGAPGVHSARFAGPTASDDDNNALLLQRLEDTSSAERSARFRCVLAVVFPATSPSPWREPVAPDAPPYARVGDWVYQSFSGALEGRIARAPAGSGGFGYDPLFELPDGRHLAELTSADKNALSHRAVAMRALENALRAGQL